MYGKDSTYVSKPVVNFGMIGSEDTGSILNTCKRDAIMRKSVSLARYFPAQTLWASVMRPLV